MLTDELAPAEDAAAAAWVLANLGGFAEGVGSIVPRCFESYARVFHPAWLDHAFTKPVRWAEVAAANGRQMHPAVEWGSITGSLDYIYNGEQRGIWQYPPALGSPPLEVAKPLFAVLASFTSTLDVCWFGVSDIWGSSPYDAVRAAPKFGTEERRYFLLKGSLRSALSKPISRGDRLPDLWWPDDHAWFVGSDVDLLSTYVGGSSACIDAILSEGSLEVLPISVDQGVAWDTDTINPLPPSPRMDTRD